MPTIAYSRSGSVQHEVDSAGSTPEYPVTFCGRNIGDRWTAREGEPNCQKCEAVSKQYAAALVINGPPPGWPPVKKKAERKPLVDLLREKAQEIQAPTTVPAPNQQDITTNYHTNRRTPPVGVSVWTPNGFGVMYQWYGPNSVLVEHGDGRIEVYQPEQTRRPSPLMDMPKRRIRHRYKPMKGSMQPSRGGERR